MGVAVTLVEEAGNWSKRVAFSEGLQNPCPKPPPQPAQPVGRRLVGPYGRHGDK